MECKDLHLDGGVVGVVNCQGDVHLHGGVVENMTVHHDCYQYGGIIERRVRMVNASDQNTRDAINEAAARQAKPLTDEINKLKSKVAEEINRLRSDNAVLKRENADLKRKVSNTGTIESVRSYNARLNSENNYLKSKIQELRAELEKRKAKPEDTPPDDVLVMRIENLNLQLKTDREKHRKEVDKLKWRIDSLLDEINNGHRQIYEDETNGHYIGVTDDTLDVLFTLINEYPIATDNDLVKEYGISMATLKYIAKTLRLAKNPEQRREARERLKRHNIEMIERRGGDQGNHVNVKPVQKMAKYGRVLKTYDSIRQAAEDTGMAYKTIQEYCASYHTSKKHFTKEGFTFRYKDNENKNSKQSR